MKKIAKYCFSIILISIFIGIGLLVLIQKGIIKIQDEKKEVIKVACIGDSITFRHGFENEPENNYPTVLAEILGEDYKVMNFGESGTCVQNDGDCPYIEQEVYKLGVEYEADILVFMIGTNDSKEWNWKNKEIFRQAYESLLDTYLHGENTPIVYICTSPKAYYKNGEVSGPAGFGIEPINVEEIVGIQREVAKERGYDLIDIYSLSVYNPYGFAEDGIHPTLEGARDIAKMIAGIIQNEK